MEASESRRMAALECALRTEGEDKGNSDRVLAVAKRYEQFLRNGTITSKACGYGDTKTATESPMGRGKAFGDFSIYGDQGGYLATGEQWDDLQEVLNPTKTATESPMQADSLDPAPDPSVAPVAEVWREGRWWMLCDAGNGPERMPMAHCYMRRPDGDWQRAGLGHSATPVPEWLLTIARALGWQGVD